MAIILVLVEPVCSLFVPFPKVGYSDEAVDPIRRFKIADSSQCDPRSKLDKIRTKNSFQKLPTRVQNSLPNIKQLPTRCIRKSCSFQDHLKTTAMNVSHVAFVTPIYSSPWLPLASGNNSDKSAFAWAGSEGVNFQWEQRTVAHPEWK